MTGKTNRLKVVRATSRRTMTAMAAAAAMTLTGCQTLQEGLESFQDGLVDATIDYHLQPTVVAAAEEYCVALDIILEQTGLADKGLSGPFVEAALTEVVKAVLEDDVPAMYCAQNLVGAAAVTDRALQMMIAEIASGFVVAYDGLEMKDKDVLDTLLAVQQLESEGAGVYAGDNVDVTIRKLDIVSAALRERIDERIAAGGLSDAAKQKLVRAAGHLRNASYYRGKALVGAWVIYREITRGGFQGVVIGSLQADDQGDVVDLLNVMATGGLTLARGTGDSLSLTNDIRELASKEEFEEALEELKGPDRTDENSLAVFAAAEEQKTDDLGLPTLQEAEL